MLVAHLDDDDNAITHNPDEVYHVEKAFPNGDIYMGQWADNCPNGHGKYLWADECMYVGDWSKGITMGKEKFSWPCGTTYEGQFKNGEMDGEGVYTGSSGESYRGNWVCNTRQGTGRRNYANGDSYDGQWRRGRPDGKGRYQWSNGNVYIGHWRHGVMSGNGTMIWTDRSRYDGSWEDDLPRGNGTYRWVDGSFYVGMWSKDQREQRGTYYSSEGSQSGGFHFDPQELYFLILSDCAVCPGEDITVFPSQKSVNWPYGPGGDLQKNSRMRSASADRGLDSSEYDLDTDSDSSLGESSENVESGRDVDGSGSEELNMSRGYNRPHIVIKPTKKQGLIIASGLKNYKLILNLQLAYK